MLKVAAAWREAGIRLVQYRDKQGSDEIVLANALQIAATFKGADATLVLNDRVHLFAKSGFHGIHVGQSDAAIADSRALIGPHAILGASTHTPQQVAAADAADVDYIAVGPVFGTQTKLDAEPVIGLEGVRAARALTAKPLIAIGGITQVSASQVLQAGADSVAVISALLPPGTAADSAVTQTARDFLAAFK